MKHCLFNESCEIIATFEQFDKDLIKAAIIERLEQVPNDLIEHCKCNGKEFDYYKSETLNYYQNHNNIPCRIITKGNKEYYSRLN